MGEADQDKFLHPSRQRGLGQMGGIFCVCHRQEFFGPRGKQNPGEVNDAVHPFTSRSERCWIAEIGADHFYVRVAGYFVGYILMMDHQP
jgi:hypothetical protein